MLYDLLGDSGEKESTENSKIRKDVLYLHIYISRMDKDNGTFLMINVLDKRRLKSIVKMGLEICAYLK